MVFLVSAAGFLFLLMNFTTPFQAFVAERSAALLLSRGAAAANQFNTMIQLIFGFELLLSLYFMVICYEILKKKIRPQAGSKGWGRQ